MLGKLFKRKEVPAPSNNGAGHQPQSPPRWRGSNARLGDDWSALATLVQQPTCQLIRNGDTTELRLTLPGVRTAELDSRRVAIEAHYRWPGDFLEKSFGRRVYAPPFWTARSEYIANRFTIVSQGDEVLELRLTIASNERDHFGLVLAVSYKLEDHRPLRHRSIFNVLDLHHHYVRGVGTTYEQGAFDYRPQEALAAKLSPTDPWLIELDELKDF
jgi:hypothetical protein